MFGSILPVKGEMKVRDFEAYRAYYCGLCKELQKSYGAVSRLFLNYDLVFLAILSDALSGATPEPKQQGCIVNPLARSCMFHNSSGLTLGADGLMLLSYHKMQDNIADERFAKRMGTQLSMPVVKPLYKKAAARHPDLALRIKTSMEQQAELEKNSCTSIDRACEPTAKMCEALFSAAACKESETLALERLGLFCGQIVYLLDAAEDYEDDKKHNSYNVFLAAGSTKEEAVTAAQARCRMAAGELASSYNLLTLQQNKDILDNILFLGIPNAISRLAQDPNTQNRRTSGHGQINSI